MQGRVLLLLFSAFIFSACLTPAEVPKRPDDVDTQVKPGLCNDCESHSPLWVKAEADYCVYEKDGEWDYSTNTCLIE